MLQMLTTIKRLDTKQIHNIFHGWGMTIVQL